MVWGAVSVMFPGAWRALVGEVVRVEWPFPWLIVHGDFEAANAQSAALKLANSRSASLSPALINRVLLNQAFLNPAPSPSRNEAPR